MRQGSPARGLLSVSSWRRLWVITSPVCSSGSAAGWRGGEHPDVPFKILMARCQVNMLQHGKGFLHPKDSGVIPGCAARLVLFYLFEGYLEGFPAVGL